MPPPFRLSAAEGLRIIQSTNEFCTLVALTPTETLRTLKSLAERNLTGGLVYDALLLECARKIGAKHIYTNNLKHFRQIAPDLVSRIHEP